MAARQPRHGVIGREAKESLVQTRDPPTDAAVAAALGQPFHQFAVSGLKDPQTDALIEKAERTTNFEENVKLVKQAQIELVKKYTAYYNICTATSRFLLNSKIQNFEVEASNVSMHRADMWFSQG